MDALRDSVLDTVRVAVSDTEADVLSDIVRVAESVSKREADGVGTSLRETDPVTVAVIEEDEERDALLMTVVVTESESDAVGDMERVADNDSDIVNDAERLIVSSAVIVEMHFSPR